MKKAITCIALLALLLTCLCAIPQQANAATEGDYEYEVYDGNATITDYTGPGGDITIPATLGGYPVTEIGFYAFGECTSLTSVTIGNSVQTIGEYAFFRCTSLTTVTIPDSVQAIGDSAFEECASLTTVTIPDSVQTIGDGAFSSCDRLTSVTIGNSVQTIGEYAFSACASLTGIWVAESNPNYSSDDRGVLFNKNKTQLLQAPGAISGSYTVPDSVQTIGEHAFQICTSLTTVTIGNSVQTIGKYAFQFCSSLTTVTIPDGVQTIGEWAFCGCTSLTSVTIPDSVQTIGNAAFSGCTSLTSVTIGNSVHTIGSWAFSDCTSLTSVTIPNSVQTIGDWAFRGCTSLTGIWVAEGNPNYSSDDRGVLFDKNKTQLILAPGGISGSYTLPDSVQTIGDGAFEDCACLTSVTIPDSVQDIGFNVFSGCASLTGIWVAENNPNYSSDDRGVLFNKNKTQLIRAPGGISGSYTVPDSVQTIGSSAFYGCNSLISLIIPDTVCELDPEAIESCQSLVSVYIGSGVHMPDLEYYIGIFDNCPSLTGFWVSENNPHYSSDDRGVLFSKAKYTLFRAPGALSGDYTIPDSVEFISACAFEGCRGLVTLTVPDSIWAIDEYAFDGCSGLTDIYYAGTEEEWEDITTRGESWVDWGDAVVHCEHVHDYSTVPPVTVAATCERDGYIEYTCVHGETYREVLPRLSHSYPEQPTVVAPTCTQEGYTSVTCSLCGHEERTDIVPALGHSMVSLPAVAPTCTQTGLTAGTVCERCQQIGQAQEEVPALGHSFTDGVCTVCGAADAIPGELDGDGEVSESDAIYLLQYILMPDLFQVSQDADFDKDGEVNEDDAIYLLQHILMPDLFPL